MMQLALRTSKWQPASEHSFGFPLQRSQDTQLDTPSFPQPFAKHDPTSPWIASHWLHELVVGSYPQPAAEHSAVFVPGTHAHPTHGRGGSMGGDGDGRGNADGDGDGCNSGSGDGDADGMGNGDGDADGTRENADGEGDDCKSGHGDGDADGRERSPPLPQQ